MDFPIIINWVSPLSFLGASEVIFLNSIQFFNENSISKHNSPRWDAAFCGVTSGVIMFAYVPIKGTPGLNELKLSYHECKHTLKNSYKRSFFVSRPCSKLHDFFAERRVF